MPSIMWGPGFAPLHYTHTHTNKKQK
jgi:hypothetical protein